MRILVIDNGIFLEHANALAENGKNKVFYYSDWQAEFFPKLEDFAPGHDFPYLIKIKKLFREIDFKRIDCVVNFDVMNNDLISYLKDQYPHLSCFGSGRGDILEDDRERLKEICKSIGLPVQKYTVLHGIDELEDYAKTHKNIYVKIDIFRGSMETIKIEDYETALKEQQFESLRLSFGYHFSKKIKFIVEDKIEALAESGFDGFYCPGHGYLNKCFVGYEYNKGPYISRVLDTDNMPVPIDDTMSRFDPVLESLDYRGALSTEEKIVSKKEHYLMDWSARLLAPGSLGYPLWIKNWAQVIEKVGRKEYVELDIPFKYVGAVPLYITESKERWVRVKLDKKYKDHLKLWNVCQDGEDYYAIKGQEGLVCLVSGGDTVQETIDNLKELSEFVDFDGIDRNQVNALDKFPELFKEGKKVGIDI